MEGEYQAVRREVPGRSKGEKSVGWGRARVTRHIFFYAWYTPCLGPGLYFVCT